MTETPNVTNNSIPFAYGESDWEVVSDESGSFTKGSRWRITYGGDVNSHERGIMHFVELPLNSSSELALTIRNIFPKGDNSLCGNVCKINTTLTFTLEFDQKIDLRLESESILLIQIPLENNTKTITFKLISAN